MCRKSLVGLLVFSFSLYLLGCGRSAEQKRAEEAAKQLQEAGRSMEAAAKGGAGLEDAMKKMSDAVTAGKKVEPVDFRELKALLPESLAGMKRTEATGQKSGAMGFSISEAEGAYQGDGDGHIRIKISDMGGVAGGVGMAAFAWAMTDIDKETESGYEKTTTLGGFKAMEKYDKESKHGEFQLLVGGRFMVEANGSDVKIDDIKNAVGKIDLKKLDGMKGEGVQK